MRQRLVRGLRLLPLQSVGVPEVSSSKEQDESIPAVVLSDAQCERAYQLKAQWERPNGQLLIPITLTRYIIYLRDEFAYWKDQATLGSVERGSQPRHGTSKEDLAFALDTIRREIQSWLDWQASERRHEGIETSDDTLLMRVPAWPTRGVLKNWVAALERAHGAVETTAALSIEHQVGDVVFSYIDRLQDQTPDDSAAKIVDEMLGALCPILDAHFDAKFGRRAVKTGADPHG